MLHFVQRLPSAKIDIGTLELTRLTFKYVISMKQNYCYDKYTHPETRIVNIIVEGVVSTSMIVTSTEEWEEKTIVW